MASHYTKKSSAVILTPALETKIEEIANAFFNIANRDIVITDGVRTAHAQAVQVYAKILSNDLTIYVNQKAAKEIKVAYDVAVNAGKPKADVIKAMAQVIQTQIDNKVYLSKHLTGRAFDVRNKGMTPKHKNTFKQVVQTVGGTSMIEEFKPPHFHLQLL